MEVAEEKGGKGGGPTTFGLPCASFQSRGMKVHNCQLDSLLATRRIDPPVELIRWIYFSGKENVCHEGNEVKGLLLVKLGCNISNYVTLFIRYYISKTNKHVALLERPG